MRTVNTLFWRKRLSPARQTAYFYRMYCVFRKLPNRQTMANKQIIHFCMDSKTIASSLPDRARRFIFQVHLDAPGIRCARLDLKKRATE